MSQGEGGEEEKRMAPEEAVCESEEEEKDSPSQNMLTCKVSFNLQDMLFYYCLSSEETETQMG